MADTFVISKGSVLSRTRIVNEWTRKVLHLFMVGLCTQCDIGTVSKDRPPETMAMILRPWVEDYIGG